MITQRPSQRHLIFGPSIQREIFLARIFHDVKAEAGMCVNALVAA
jgi:hypothetical protein